MKRILFVASLGLACMSQAALNLNLDQYMWEVSPGGSVTITGSITLEDGWVLLGGTSVEHPGNGTDFLTASFHADLIAFYDAGVPGADYVGNLFTVTAPADADLGVYSLNDGGFNPLAEMIAHAGITGGPTTNDNEMFAVSVVPEPASLAALGIAAVAVLRRRKK